MSDDLALRNLLTDAAQILDVVKGEWGVAWSEWDQSVRDRLSTTLQALSHPPLEPTEQEIEAREILRWVLDQCEVQGLVFARADKLLEKLDRKPSNGQCSPPAVSSMARSAEASDIALTRTEQEVRDAALEDERHFNTELTEELCREMRRAPELAGVIKAALREHWLTWIGCDEEMPKKTDRTRSACYCGVWRSDPLPTIGAALEAWITHLFEHIALKSTPTESER